MPARNCPTCGGMNVPNNIHDPYCDAECKPTPSKASDGAATTGGKMDNFTTLDEVREYWERGGEVLLAIANQYGTHYSIVKFGANYLLHRYPGFEGHYDCSVDLRTPDLEQAVKLLNDKFVRL